jgi:hypothetical protein
MTESSEQGAGSAAAGAEGAVPESAAGGPAGSESAAPSPDGLAKAEKDEADVSSPAKVMRIGTMVKQLLEEVRDTELDEKGRQRLAEIHRRSIDELEDGLSKELIDELERLNLPFDSDDGPPTTSELRIAQAQLVGWLEGLFHGIQTAIAAQQAMAQQLAARGQLPAGMVVPGMAPPGPEGQGGTGQSSEEPESGRDDRGTGNYL